MSRNRAPSSVHDQPPQDDYRHNLSDPANILYLSSYSDLTNPNVYTTGSQSFQSSADARFNRLKPSNLARIRGFGIRDVNEANIVQLREAQQTMFLQQFRMFPDVSSSASADQYIKAEVDKSQTDSLQASLATILHKANSALIGEVSTHHSVSAQANEVPLSMSSSSTDFAKSTTKSTSASAQSQDRVLPDQPSQQNSSTNQPLRTPVQRGQPSQAAGSKR